MGSFSLKLKADFILSGIAVNMLGASGTIFHLRGDCPEEHFPF
jgi:ABC-type uncharacterized transport system permease subunit